MNTIKSSIKLDENTWLYSLELPWIKRYFEWIYYCFEWNNKHYWKYIDKFRKIDLWNRVLWISSFYESFVICFIDLENLSSKYFFAKAFDVFEFSLEEKNITALFVKNLIENIVFYITINEKTFL